MVGVAHLKMNRPDLAGPVFVRIAPRRERPRLDPCSAPFRWPARSASTPTRPSRAAAAAGPTGRRPPPPAAPARRNEGKSPNEAYRTRPGRDQPARRLRRLRRQSTGPTTPTVGQRIPVLGSEGTVEADPAARRHAGHRAGAGRQYRLGAARRQCRPSRWAMSRSATTPRQAWSVSIGNGNSFRTRLVSEPVVADGRVYTIDTLARVRAFNVETGAEIWDAPGARREQPARGPVRRRRHLRRRPHLRDQRRRRRRRARRRDRQPASGW